MRYLFFKHPYFLSSKNNNGESLKADVSISLGFGTLALVFLLIFLNSQTASEEKDYNQPKIEVCIKNNLFYA